MIRLPRVRPYRPKDIEEMAAAWLLEVETGVDPRRRSEFEAWLQDNRHAEAFEAVQRVDSTAMRHAATPELLALRSVALVARSDRVTLRWASFAACFVAAMLGAATIGMLGPWYEGGSSGASAPVQERHLAFATDIGEQRSITLPDGSRVVLDTATALDVVFDGRERTIRLARGRAHFVVAPEIGRPFRVYAGDRVVTAHGTAFDVRLIDRHVRVVLLEGTVAVAPAAVRSPGDRAVGLRPGQTLTAMLDGNTIKSSGNVERLTSWTTGMITFEDTPLDEAVTEMNRYTRQPILLGNLDVRRYRLTGSFKAGNSASLAESVSALFGLKTQETSDGQIIITEMQ